MQRVKNGAPSDQTTGTKAVGTARSILAQNAGRIALTAVGITCRALALANRGAGIDAVLISAYGGALLPYAILGDVF